LHFGGVDKGAAGSGVQVQEILQRRNGAVIYIKKNSSKKVDYPVIIEGKLSLKATSEGCAASKSILAGP